MGDFRFSFNVLGFTSAEALAETCRRGERYGYDTVFTADHLGTAAPFSTLVAAAAATERMKVGTLVLNAAFWNPSLLAREVATTDVLTGGRLELGLGAGHMKWEFEEAGIPWEPFAERADRLEAAIGELGRLFAADGYPQQAASRDVEWHVLTQMVIETPDRRAAAAKLIEQYSQTMSEDELLDTPFVLVGTVEQMAEQILRNRERFGFTYYTVHAPFMEAFAPVIERVRAQAP